MEAPGALFRPKVGNTDNAAAKPQQNVAHQKGGCGEWKSQRRQKERSRRSAGHQKPRSQKAVVRQKTHSQKATAEDGNPNVDTKRGGNVPDGKVIETACVRVIDCCEAIHADCSTYHGFMENEDLRQPLAQSPDRGKNFPPSPEEYIGSEIDGGESQKRQVAFDREMKKEFKWGVIVEMKVRLRREKLQLLP